jgi:group I intron endonuclease
MTTGVYAIRNVLNGEVYIGAAKDVVRRWRHHKRTLKQNTSHHPKLQQAWLTYGEGCFEFVMLELSTNYKDVESRYLHLSPQYNATLNSNGGRGKGWVMSESERAKHLGRVVSPETRRKISEAKKGSKHTEEAKRKVSEFNKGKIVSEETKLKVSQSIKAHWLKRRER